MSTIYTDPPQSRNEAIIKSTIDGTQYTDPPQSRMEDLLLDLKEAIEGGGGGGTTVVANPEGEATDELEKLQVGNDIYEIPKDYEDLDNKPQINGETLIGNKTASELGLQAELDGAQTVSGNPITITDAEAMNAESVVVELEPKQDLHGYDAPWVGGSGKNKLPLVLADIKTVNTSGTWSGNTYTLNGVTFEVLTDSADNVLGVKVNGTASASTNFGLTDKLGDMSGLKYNGAGAGTTNNKCLIVGYWDAQGEWIGDGRAYGGNDYTLLDYPQMSFGIYVQNTQTLTDETFYPMIRLSTESDPTFTPYSNICPITGYSEVNVVNFDNSNLFDESSAQNGYFDNSGNLISNAGWKSNYIDVTEGAYYRISGCNEMIGGAYFIWFDSNKDKISIVSEHKNGIYLAPTNAFYLGVSEATGNENISVTTGNTYTISLGGTKYGGTLDVTEGVLTVAHGFVQTTWGEMTNPQVSGDYTFKTISNLNCKSTGDAVGNLCNLTDNEASNLNQNVHYWCQENLGAVVALPSDTPNDTVIQIYYELLTPSSVSTTPTDIPLLENTNNISTDGTNITLKYQPNNVIGECKAYTDEKCSEVLPPLPTTDGTYHLSCEVTSGVGVLSWVSDS